MVYCQKCGTLNMDSATNCSNCGSPLYAPESRPYTRHEWRRYHADEYRYHRRGSRVGLLITGLFVLFIGLAALFGSLTIFWQYFWPAVLILIGLWLLVWGLIRNRHLREPPPP